MKVNINQKNRLTMILYGKKIEIDFKMLSNVDNSKVKFFPPLRKDDIKDYYTNLSFPSQNRCLKPWFACFLTPNCDIMPCEQSRPVIVGNLKEQMLSEIWNGNEFREFRKRIQKMEFGTRALDAVIDNTIE